MSSLPSQAVKFNAICLTSIVMWGRNACMPMKAFAQYLSLARSEVVYSMCSWGCAHAA